ncbi:MAG: TerB family tellurite resistance protein [Bacteroidota bacterium]
MDNFEQKKTHLHMLMEIAMADRDFSQVEDLFLNRIAQVLNIPLEEVVHQEFDRNDLQLPRREFKLYGLFHRLVLMGLSDNHLHTAERKLLLDFGIRMGLNPSAILEVMDYCDEKGLAAIPKDIVRIFYKYNN